MPTVGTNHYTLTIENVSHMVLCQHNGNVLISLLSLKRMTQHFVLITDRFSSLRAIQSSRSSVLMSIPSILEPLIYELQHGFVWGKSTTTQLLEVYNNILESVVSGKEVDAIFLDLSKALDKVSYNQLLKA